MRETVRWSLKEMLLWFLVFLMGLTMIFGHVRLYELELQIDTMEQQLAEKQLTLGTLRNKRQQILKQLDVYAEDLGMYMPEPEEYIVIHVQGTNP